MHLIKAKVPEVVWCQGATICVGKCALFVSKCRVSRDTHDTYPDVDFSACVCIFCLYINMLLPTYLPTHPPTYSAIYRSISSYLPIYLST